MFFGILELALLGIFFFTYLFIYVWAAFSVVVCMHVKLKCVVVACVVVCVVKIRIYM